MFNTYKVYLHICFLSSFFFTAVFTVNLLYHVQTVQLSPIELVLVGTILELTVFIFEIPTGYISDLRSRKLSIIMGYTLIGFAFLIEGSFPVLTAVIISQVLWGIGYTCTSGSLQAWLSDEIGEEKASSAFLSGAKFSNLGMMLAIPFSIASGYLSLQLPIIIGGIGMIGLAIYLVFILKEEKFIPATRNSTSAENMKHTAGKIFTYISANRIFRILLLITLFFGLYSEGFDRLWLSHLLKNISITDENLVLLTGGIQIVVVFFSFICLRMLNKSKIHQQIRWIYIALFTGALIIIFSLLGFALSEYFTLILCFYVIIQITRKIMQPLEDIWLNSMIPDSSSRATFFSIKGQVDSIGQIGGGPVIGTAASFFSIKTSLILCALLLSPVILLFKKLKRIS